MKPFDAIELANAVHAVLAKYPTVAAELNSPYLELQIAAHALLAEIFAAELPFEFRRRDLELTNN